MMTDLGHAYRGRVQVALVLDLMAPVVAWFILKSIGRSRARKAAQKGL